MKPSNPILNFFVRNMITLFGFLIILIALGLSRSIIVGVYTLYYKLTAPELQNATYCCDDSNFNPVELKVTIRGDSMFLATCNQEAKGTFSKKNIVALSLKYGSYHKYEIGLDRCIVRSGNGCMSPPYWQEWKEENCSGVRYEYKRDQLIQDNQVFVKCKSN